jgi:hypothetical protein
VLIINNKLSDTLAHVGHSEPRMGSRGRTNRAAVQALHLSRSRTGRKRVLVMNHPRCGTISQTERVSLRECDVNILIIDIGCPIAVSIIRLASSRTG